MRLVITAVLAGVVVVAGVAAADAAPRPRGTWATVNVCDTEASPNAMGVRARMPGNGTHQRMYVRFRARWFDEDTGRWSTVRGVGRSRWMRLGSAGVRYREGGYTFFFDPPAEGHRYVLRGLVEYEWRERRWVGRRVRRVRRNGKVKVVVVRRGRLRTVVVRRVRANTKGGFDPGAGSDPPGFSSGLCEIR